MNKIKPVSYGVPEETPQQFSDFYRLAKGLRAKKIDFNYFKIKKMLGPHAENIGGYTDEKEAIIADDVELAEANLLTSQHRDSGDEGYLHRVVLDLDYDAVLIPSTTPGHHHLILDVNLPWSTYAGLLRALVRASVIEEGYAEASIRKGYSAIRPPWEKKDELI